MNMRKFTPMKTTRTHKAFTLIEILIVVGILALLMGLTTQMLSTVSANQGRAKARTDMALIASALESFASKYGGYPRVNAGSDEKKAAADLYKCLAGKMVLRVDDGQIIMSDVGTARKPVLEVSKLTIADPTDQFAQNVDPEKNGVYFCDPWSEPYLYFFDTTSYVTNEENTSWRSPSFVLLSKGADTKAVDVKNMYTSGIIPNDDDYRMPEQNIDNILYGRDD